MQASYRIELGADVYLRVMREVDVTPEYVAALNDPVVHRFLVGPRTRWQTMDSVRAYVRANLDDAASLFFGLYIHDVLRGTVRLHEISRISAYLGLAIFDRQLWGQGLGTRCIRSATCFAQGELGIRQVVAVIEAENLASQKAFERAGYVRIANNALQRDVDLARQLWVSPSPVTAASSGD